MASLIEDLESSKQNLEEFFEVTKRVLLYIPNVVSNTTTYRDYKILTYSSAGTTKMARPINKILFIDEVPEFENKYNDFIKLMKSFPNIEDTTDNHNLINSVVYTMQQSIGVGLDFLSEPNSARKHVGNRFEELIRGILTSLPVSNGKVVFKIPYPTENGEKTYSCETDMVFSNHQNIKSNPKNIEEGEIVVSLKTSSKDRMGKIFLDKMLMEKFAKHPVKVIGIFLNDVQRKSTDKISYTFVSGLFMVYTKFLTELEGIYFIDVPDNAKKNPFNEHVFSFSKLLISDITRLLAS